jgi:hypothetical protein
VFIYPCDYAPIAGSTFALATLVPPWSGVSILLDHLR